MAADGTKQAQVTHLKGRVLFPDVSPNGKTIAFAGTAGTDAHTEVYVVNSTTGEDLVALTSCKGKLEGCANDYPAWSPDGKHIVFVHQDDYVADKPVNEQIWLMDADGGNQHALTTGAEPKDQLPSWSPDGKFITYASGFGDNEGIWVMAADGSARPAHRLPAAEGTPARTAATSGRSGHRTARASRSFATSGRSARTTDRLRDERRRHRPRAPERSHRPPDGPRLASHPIG